ncbi:hypothetical protein ACJMK2_014816 [Sinanodonta woodiana]|uniref:Uncharacterized protein n=1 Tax=Sinanodonta woodiana TaxID=1069815 RepID=A0ABD3V1U1_SINWO
MAVHMATSCYIFTLSTDDQADVHTDTALRTLEIKLIRMIGSLTKTAVTKDSLDDSVAAACGEFVRHYYTVSEA